MLKMAEFRYFILNITHKELYKNINIVMRVEYNDTKRDSIKLNN
jgi:hypothetical protein|tara:strand:+ start:451 stop:582 length:132 start_codon:yes stop_codon:yes gene_type:complete